MTLVQKEVKKVTVWRDTTRLPSEYQEVEYIESSGTQYFVVGSSFKTSYKSVIDLEMVVTGGDYIPLGVHNDAGKRYGIDAYGGKFTIISGGGSWTNTATEDTNRHLITIDKTTATVDGTSYSISYVDYTYNKGVGVFGYHNTQTNGVNYKSSSKLYKLDIYDENGTHIYDLVPCYRKSDTVIGMYDLINDVFYTNNGTGTFTKGSDVYSEQEVKNMYIGEYIAPRTPGVDTILYLPFKTDLLDHSQTGLSLTNSGNVTISNGAAYFDGSSYLYSKAFTQINQSNFTASVWFKSTSTANTERICLHQFRYYSGYRGYCMGITGTNLNAQNTYLKTKGESTTVTSNERHNLILVRDSVNQTSQFYFNGQAITMKNTNNYPELYGWLGIGGGMWYNATMGEYKWIGYMSNIIYENKARTSQEVADYYNSTKTNYGIS